MKIGSWANKIMIGSMGAMDKTWTQDCMIWIYNLYGVWTLDLDFLSWKWRERWPKYISINIFWPPYPASYFLRICSNSKHICVREYEKKGMLEKVGRINIRKIENICVFTLYMLGLENRKVKEHRLNYYYIFII